MSEKIDIENCNFPVYATQGGGMARSVGTKFIFISRPNCPGLVVGDEVPQEWDTFPINALAQQEVVGMSASDEDLLLLDSPYREALIAIRKDRIANSDF